MDPESYSVDQILEAIDTEMETLKPKVLLFDIGGVCVSRHLENWFSRPPARGRPCRTKFMHRLWLLRKKSNVEIHRLNRPSK